MLDAYARATVVEHTSEAARAVSGDEAEQLALRRIRGAARRGRQQVKVVSSTSIADLRLKQDRLQLCN
jgi:hypothetical protein